MHFFTGVDKITTGILEVQSTSNYFHYSHSSHYCRCPPELEAKLETMEKGSCCSGISRSQGKGEIIPRNGDEAWPSFRYAMCFPVVYPKLSGCRNLWTAQTLSDAITPLHWARREASESTTEYCI